MSDSAQISRELLPGGKHEHHKDCCNHGEQVHVHVHIHHCCKNNSSSAVKSGEEKPFEVVKPSEGKPCKDENKEENFEGVPSQFISVGGVIETETMTIEHVAGGGHSGIEDVEKRMINVGDKIIGTFIKGNGLSMSCTSAGTMGQTLRLTLKGTCRQVKFWGVWMDYPLEARFYKKGEAAPLGKVNLSGKNKNERVDFTAKEGEEIAVIELQNFIGDWMSFDFFEFIGWCPLE